jgi:NADP-dependent 3-hydroxy acid dehydrogenase YdfG
VTYEMGDLRGRVVIITGATAGIGAATARELVGQGARVVLNARNRVRLAEMIDELGSDHAVAVAGDCTDPQVCRETVMAAINRWGRLDAAIPNAGVGLYGSVLDYADDEVNAMMRTNFEGTVHVVRAALPTLLEGDGGDIVIVSSVAGFRGGADEAIYAGTKHAQVGFAGALDRELRAKGVRVTLVCPGGTDTEFALGTGRTAGSPELADYLRPEDVAFQIVTVLRQPRSVRSHVWTLWSMRQQS